MTRDNVRRLDLDAAEREASGDPGGAVSDAWCECCGWRGAHDAHDPECSLFQAHAEIARLTAERDQAVAHRAATNEEIKRLHAAIKGKGFSVEDSIALHEMRSEVARLTAELDNTRTATELAQAAADRRGAKVEALTAELAAIHTTSTIEAAIDRLKLSEAAALKARSGEWDLTEIAAANAESHAAELALIAAILVAQEAARRDPSRS